MAKRKIHVEMTCQVTLVVDDEVTTPEYEGETLMTAYLNPDRMVQPANPDHLWLYLAEWCGVRGRRISSIDGYADFPDEALHASSGEFQVESVWEETDG